MELLFVVSWLLALSFPLVLCLGLVWALYSFLNRVVSVLTGCF